MSWNTLHHRIKSICPQIIRIFRLRWVDDLFFYLVSTSEIEEDIFGLIQKAFSDSYAPFSLKIEDPQVFVGFRHHVSQNSEGRSCINFSIDTRTQLERLTSKIPRFVHAKSNMPQAQEFALFKGSIIRCVDCSSSEEMCYHSIMCTAEEFRYVGFPSDSFCRALRAVSKQYTFLLPIAQIIANRCSNR